MTCIHHWASLVAQTVKNLPAVWEIWAQSLGWEDPLEESKAMHSSILAWRISMDRGTWQDSLWGLKELDTTEQLSIGTSTIAIASFRISFFCGGKYNYFSMLC